MADLTELQEEILHIVADADPQQIDAVDLFQKTRAMVLTMGLTTFVETFVAMGEQGYLVNIGSATRRFSMLGDRGREYLKKKPQRTVRMVGDVVRQITKEIDNAYLRVKRA